MKRIFKSGIVVGWSFGMREQSVDSSSIVIIIALYLIKKTFNIKVKSSINPYYIVSFLNSEYGQMQLERISSGSILQSIRSSDLKKIKIILPPKGTQDSIGAKLKEAVCISSSMRKNIKQAENDISQLC